MTSIKQQVVDKITQLGDKSPEYFGKSAQTIKVWLKNPEKIPMAAIEQVLNDQELEADIQDGATTPEYPKGRMVTPDEMSGIWDHLKNLNDRLTAIEQLAQAAQQPIPNAQTPVMQLNQSGPPPSIIEANPLEQNASSMTRPGREPEMRVVPPKDPRITGVAPVPNEAFAQPQPQPVQATSVPPTIPNNGWLTPHPIRRQ